MLEFMITIYAVRLCIRDSHFQFYILYLQFLDLNSK